MISITGLSTSQTQDNSAKALTQDESMRRLQEQIYLQQYAAMMNQLDPSYGFEIR